MLCALWLAVASPLILPAGAAPESARTPAGLEPAAARKLDPILWRALAAADAASRGSAPAGEALWLALTPGAGSSAAGPVVDLLVRMQDIAAPAAAATVQAHDLVPDAVLGSIVTLSQVPLAKVADLARDPAIAFLQPARSYHTMNDVSVPETGAPQVWAKHGYTGQGVLVAIIDTGIDPDHPDFQHANGTTRIRYLLDLADPGSGPLGGTLYTASQINAGPIATTDPVGHGTHVAGTAAGNGSADLAFSGMAPEADLIIVNASRAGNGSFSSTDIVNSLAFVDAQAATLGMPYVANLSLGGHDGAHDGTALEEVAIDNLIGEGKTGKAVVIAAGNDRSGEPRHAQAIVNDGGLNLRLGVPDYTPQPGTGNDYAVVHVWYEASSDFRITLTSPTGHSFGTFAPNEWNGENGENTNQGLVGVANALGGVSSENGDREAEIILFDGGGTPPAEGTWQIRFEGDTGPIDAYVAQSTFGAQFLNYTTPGGFVAEPGTARNAITVGAYITKVAWTDKDGNAHDLGAPPFNLTVGELAVFSNAGPTRDGRLKPEIAAPGQEIASTYTPDAPPSSPVSAYQTPFLQFPNFFLLAGDHYAIQQGTSQAAPHVTGAVALLLQQNPDWDQLDLRRALTGSARADAFTGTVPNQGFGYGKLDVLAAVVAAKAQLLPDGDVSGDQDVDLEDIQLAIGFVLGNSTPTVDEETRADMNRDHLLNIGDVVLIVRASLAGGLTGASAPANDHGTAPWLVPVTVVPDVKGAQVSGLDLTLAAGSAAIVGSVRPGADGILALDAPRPDGGRRVIALATDGSDLTQRTAFLVPVATESAALALRQIELIAPSGKSVPGTIRLGAPLPPAAPQKLAIATLRPEPGRGPRTIVVDVPSSIAPGGPAAGAASAATDARSVTVAIYDASGRHVRTLTRNPLAPGRHELVWDGRGARGPVAAGVYWVRLAMGSEIVSARLTVLK
jgi:subtilisin family serine protease